MFFWGMLAGFGLTTSLNVIYAYLVASGYLDQYLDKIRRNR